MFHFHNTPRRGDTTVRAVGALILAVLLSACSSAGTSTTAITATTAAVPTTQSLLIPGTVPAGALAVEPSAAQSAPPVQEVPSSTPQVASGVSPLADLINIGNQQVAYINQIVGDPAAYVAGVGADGNFAPGSITKLEFDNEQSLSVAAGLTDEDAAQDTAVAALHDANNMLNPLIHGSSLTPQDIARIKADLATWTSYSSHAMAGG